MINYMVIHRHVVTLRWTACSVLVRQLTNIGGNIPTSAMPRHLLPYFNEVHRHMRSQNRYLNLVDSVWYNIPRVTDMVTAVSCSPNVSFECYKSVLCHATPSSDQNRMTVGYYTISVLLPFVRYCIFADLNDDERRDVVDILRRVIPLLDGHVGFVRNGAVFSLYNEFLMESLRMFPPTWLRSAILERSTEGDVFKMLNEITTIVYNDVVVSLSLSFACVVALGAGKPYESFVIDNITHHRVWPTTMIHDNPRSTDVPWCYLVHYAALSGNTEMVKMIIRHGASVNSVDFVCIIIVILMISVEQHRCAMHATVVMSIWHSS